MFATIELLGLDAVNEYMILSVVGKDLVGNILLVSVVLWGVCLS